MAGACEVEHACTSDREFEVIFCVSQSLLSVVLLSFIHQDPFIRDASARLSSTIQEGIRKFGIVEPVVSIVLLCLEVLHPICQDKMGGSNKWCFSCFPYLQPGVKMYAYEVDGLGNSLADFDDPNLPSLLAMPLLGFDNYDKEVGFRLKYYLQSPMQDSSSFTVRVAGSSTHPPQGIPNNSFSDSE